MQCINYKGHWRRDARRPLTLAFSKNMEKAVFLSIRVKFWNDSVTIC